MRQPVSAKVFPVTRKERNWEYLLLKRIAMPQLDLPVFWQGVSGGVEDSESIFQAAERELLEETGIIGAPLHEIEHVTILPMKTKWEKKYIPGTKEIVEHTFVCILEKALKPMLSGEHSEFAWLSYTEAYDKLHFQGNKVSLSAVLNWLIVNF
jgi:8-oxo-dGTP pyrophosphatase MutT (NUDIX family)